MKRVCVTWLDAHVCGTSLGMEEIRNLGPIVTYSVGSLLHEDVHGVAIVMDTYGKATEFRWTNVNYIPRCMIQRVEYL